MPEPPVLDAEKRREGFEKSLALRRVRAEFKAQLAQAGAPFLLDNWSVEDIQGMRIFDLLRALPGVGPSRAARMMQSAGIAHSRTVARIGDKQRGRLFTILDK